MSEPEPNFEDDLDVTNEAVNKALNALTDVKAYTLTVDELRDFKAAQYALRNISDEKSASNDVPQLYETRIEVQGDERNP